ncbi:unnamed protein product [Adineta steineri]|uniref:G-protein coupled receptors family 1 profile domain-containing protein n=1 Tax=Adineta steineri TaxID=433720 RepID=A0A814AW14_9BILA|nr:unnamed protein product [Adineta steineri]CAF0860349.1 unnamed protein product [Adineta steineri]CAF0920926.1 unnamed protein product [Adineta steineri]
MSSSSDANIIALLNNTSIQLNRYLAISIFLFGIIGHTLNILVLSQRPLRSNPCSCLFLVSSISYLISIMSGLIPRFLSTWNADMTNINQFLCKIRVFIFFNSLTIAFWLIMLATIDRWLCSSINVHRRQRSTLKNAQRGIICIIILSTIIQTQQIFCYEANLINTPIKCYTKTVTCGILTDTSFALITVLIPLLFMFIFGLMTISNVRQTQARLRPMVMTSDNNQGQNTRIVVIGRQNQQKKADRQLLKMLFVQVLVILIFTVPLALSKLYTTFTRDMYKSAIRNTIENFIFNLFLLLSNVASGMPFYIYTLTGGSVFRKALFNLVKYHYVRK